MPIKIQCQCGKAYKVRDDQLGRSFLCPACKARVVVEAPSVFVPAAKAPGPVIDDSGIDLSRESESRPVAKRPFWKDPILIGGGSIPVIILICFFIYLYRERTQAAFHQKILEMKGVADDFGQKGEVIHAYFAYSDLLKYAGESVPSDAQAAANIESARNAVAKLHPQVIAMRDQATADARRILEEMARQKEREAEADRLAKMNCVVTGTMFVNLKFGGTKTLAGTTVYVLHARVPRSRLDRAMKDAKALVKVQAGHIQDAADRVEGGAKAALGRDHEERLALATKFDDVLSKDADDPIDLKQIHTLIRKLYTTAKPRDVLTIDEIWPVAAAAGLAAQGDTSLDGRFKIEDLKGGEYYVYSLYMNELSIIEWLFPLTVDKPEVTCDLHNNKAFLIHNKGDDK